MCVNKYVYLIDWTLTDTINSNESGHESNGKKGSTFPKSSKRSITIKLSIVSYSGHLYFSLEVGVTLLQRDTVRIFEASPTGLTSRRGHQ